MKRLLFGIAIFSLALTCFTVSTSAGDAKVAGKVITDGLVHPTGIAIHPKTGQLYVAESGSGRVIQVNPKDGKVTEVVTGSDLDLYGKGPKYKIGPLGVMFMGADKLFVSGGDQKDGSELVRVYDLPKKLEKPLNVNDVYASFGPVKDGPDTKGGEGNFYAMAADKNGVYVTSNGDDTKGWILKITLPIKAGKNQKLAPFIATKTFIEEINAPVGITMSKKGNLVVGQMGAVNKPRDSWLTMYNPATGKGIAKAETGLFDISGVAYSPKTGKLYCTDFAWLAPKEGGLFRLDVSDKDGKVTVTAVKIASLEKPTALAFAPDGTLYVTVNGAANLEAKEKTGKIVQFAPGL